MKKYEKVITACATLIMGVLLLVLKSNVISILMTVLGVGLIALGIKDIVGRQIPFAIIKLVCGVLIIVCGWALLSAVLYVLAALLLIYGVFYVYYNIKHRVRGCTPFHTFCFYLIPALCLAIGFLLLFHGAALDLVLIICGILTILEGCVLLLHAVTEK